MAGLFGNRNKAADPAQAAVVREQRDELVQGDLVRKAAEAKRDNTRAINVQRELRPEARTAGASQLPKSGPQKANRSRNTGKQNPELADLERRLREKNKGRQSSPKQDQRHENHANAADEQALRQQQGRSQSAVAAPQAQPGRILKLRGVTSTSATAEEESQSAQAQGAASAQPLTEKEALERARSRTVRLQVGPFDDMQATGVFMPGVDAGRTPRTVNFALVRTDPALLETRGIADDYRDLRTPVSPQHSNFSPHMDIRVRTIAELAGTEIARQLERLDTAQKYLALHTRDGIRRECPVDEGVAALIADTANHYRAMAA